jgi:hypothetical protein
MKPVAGEKTMTEEINQYLIALRDSGRINMFGATPYLMDRFGLSRKQASFALLKWIESFNRGASK